MVHDCEPGDALTVYDVAVPSGMKDTLTVPLLIKVAVGVASAELAIKAAVVATGALSVPPLDVTEKVYEVPTVRPVTAQVSDCAVAPVLV